MFTKIFFSLAFFWKGHQLIIKIILSKLLYIHIFLLKNLTEVGWMGWGWGGMLYHFGKPHPSTWRWYSRPGIIYKLVCTFEQLIGALFIRFLGKTVTIFTLLKIQAWFQSLDTKTIFRHQDYTMGYWETETWYSTS